MGYILCRAFIIKLRKMEYETLSEFLGFEYDQKTAIEEV